MLGQVTDSNALEKFLKLFPSVNTSETWDQFKPQQIQLIDLPVQRKQYDIQNLPKEDKLGKLHWKSLIYSRNQWKFLTWENHIQI